VLDGSVLLLAGFVIVTGSWLIVGLAGLAIYRRMK
jgi:hypothetical protein